MNIIDVMAMNEDELPALDQETKISVLRETWPTLEVEDKKHLVLYGALTVIAGVADLPVFFATMELAEADGLSVPPWRDLRDAVDSTD